MHSFEVREVWAVRGITSFQKNQFLSLINYNDILFKWGLLGSLKKSIPLEFRSFYLGSKGWSLKRFAEEIGAFKNNRKRPLVQKRLNK